jgi:hypothetical protein
MESINPVDCRVRQMHCFFQPTVNQFAHHRFGGDLKQFLFVSVQVYFETFALTFELNLSSQWRNISDV